jgi:phosphohistidine phosphatase
MDLLLWRHGETGDGAEHDELNWPLSVRGHKQAAQIADWLKQQRLPRLRVLTSPALRARETADALACKHRMLPALAPGHSSAELLAAIGWPDSADPVLLVGHQPGLGRLASLLLAGQEAEWTIKKGGLWWFSNRVRRDESQTVLRAVINP